MAPPSPGLVSFDGITAMYEQHRTMIMAAVDAALSAGPPLDGPAVAELERRCATALGRSNAVAVGSGTDALTLALRALGVGPGDEVLVTSFSFVASATPILQVGACPVFLPIDPATYGMRPDAIKSAITAKTKAIIAVHLFGRCHPEMADIERIATENGLHLIEDAAQAFGARIDGRPAGSFGVASALSFDPSKVLGGISTGGLVATDDFALATTLRALRSHGRDETTGQFLRLGLNSRTSAANAAVLLHHLDHQREWRRSRAAVAQRYRDELADVPGYQLPPTEHGDDADNHHKFVIQTDARDRLRSRLRDRGIETKVHYASALPDQPVFAGTSRIHESADDARRAAARVLSLPIHPALTATDVDLVVAALREVRC